MRSSFFIRCSSVLLNAATSRVGDAIEPAVHFVAAVLNLQLRNLLVLLNLHLKNRDFFLVFRESLRRRAEDSVDTPLNRAVV